MGLLHSEMETVCDWWQPDREGVIYYLDNGQVRGVLLWNVWDQVEAAGTMIADKTPFQEQTLIGRVPHKA